MAGRNRPKVVLRKTSPITKAVVVATAILSVIALVALYGAIESNRQQYLHDRDQALAREAGNATLKDNIEDLGTLESALRIAMEELGLTFPDSLIFAPGD